MMIRSARLRVSVRVEVVQPTVCNTLVLRILPLAQGMVDDAAAPLGKRHRRAHAVDVGGEPAKERQLGTLDQRRGGLDGLIERHLLAGDHGRRLRQRPLKSGDRFAATIVADLELAAFARDIDVVAQHAAKRACHILEQLGRSAAARGVARGRSRHEVDL